MFVEDQKNPESEPGGCMIIASFTPGQSTPPVLSLSFSNPPQIQSIPQMSFNVNLENQNLKKKNDNKLHWLQKYSFKHVHFMQFN